MIKAIVKSLIPRSVLRRRRQRLIARRQGEFASRTVAETFSEIYRNNVWGGNTGEFFSGDGSRGRYAEVYATAVREFIAENDIEHVVDLGCGDFKVASQFVSDDIHYTGCDVVPDLVEHLNSKFGGEKVEFRTVNIVEDELPDGELCLIRQVLQHLSNAEIERILGRCRKYRYLIVTEHYPSADRELTPNLDITHGPDTRLHFDFSGRAGCPAF